MHHGTEQLCLTINDYIELPGGVTLPYVAIPCQTGLVQKDVSHIIEIVSERSGDIPTNSAGLQPQVIYEDEIRRESYSTHHNSHSLPPGKKFHVFFSHSSEDREWVLRMVTKLESAEYGFKCCFADRDFDLGAPVFENIAKCINLSKKTVIVMSPEFLESSWCSYETRITMEMDLDTRQRLLVPVMLRNCKVPEFIGRLSYIEADNDHFFERFQQALSDESSESAFNEAVGSAAIMGGGPFHFNPSRFFNTDIITEEITAYVGCSCCTESSAEFMPNALLHHGLQLTAEEYNEIVRNISGIFYVRCRGLHNKGLFWTCLLLSQIFLLLISMWDLQFTEHRLTDALWRFSMLPFTAVVMIVIRLLLISRAIKTLPTKTVTANKIAIRSNMMVVIKDHGCCYCACDRISIIFMYYDWRPCHSYLKTLLLNMEMEHNQEAQAAAEEDEPINPRALQFESSTVSQEMLESIQDRVDTLLFHHATEYGQLVLSRRTKYPSEQRHTRQKECLCQFVESILLSKKSSCLDCLYGGPTRHPWRQLIEF